MRYYKQRGNNYKKTKINKVGGFVLKKLVVFYSLEGNTKYIAQAIAEEIAADLLELKAVKEINKKSLFRFLHGGKQAIRKEQPELLPLDKDPQDYDLIILGTPVWAWTYSAPLHTFLCQNKIENKKIAFFCCHGGDKGKTLQHLENILKDNKILGKSDYFNPLKKDPEQNRKKAVEWAKGITISAQN
jgi:flavodoxin